MISKKKLDVETASIKDFIKKYDLDIKVEQIELNLWSVCVPKLKIKHFDNTHCIHFKPAYFIINTVSEPSDTEIYNFLFDKLIDQTIQVALGYDVTYHEKIMLYQGVGN